VVNEVITKYQEEIDQLSRRCKKSEASFTALYKSMYEAPDPVEVIESLMGNVQGNSAHLIEIDRLKSEVAQYVTMPLTLTPTLTLTLTLIVILGMSRSFSSCVTKTSPFDGSSKSYWTTRMASRTRCRRR